MPDSQPGPARPIQHEVLITRAAEAGGRTVALVRALGFSPVLAPLFQVCPRPMRWPGGIDAILLTSGNAVEAVAAGPRLPVFAVGDATAERARLAGFDRVSSAAGDAAALLTLARAALHPGASVLLATGAGQGAWLAAGLRAAGFRVHRRVAYAACAATRLPDAAAAAIMGGRLCAVLFLSAETARIFCRLLPQDMQAALAQVDALAIAPSVAVALAPLPWRRVRVSVAPTLDQVLALLLTTTLPSNPTPARRTPPNARGSNRPAPPPRWMRCRCSTWSASSSSHPPVRNST